MLNTVEIMMVKIVSLYLYNLVIVLLPTLALSLLSETEERNAIFQRV